MKSRLVLIVEALLLAGALALAAPAAAGAASPAKGGHGSTTTTTTTTKPGSSSGSAAAFATLVIKPASIGHVAVEQAGTSTFAPGTNNEQLHVGDTVQTDSVGLAEIDYATNAYTRLNVNTTFTIKKLTDNQGNRQVDGGLTSGETWNRTAQLTQSESFQQDGGGVTAAVSGTAFVANCTTPTACTFTAVIDNTNLTGPNGQTETLNPLTQCVTQNATLCASPTMLTPDQLALIQWIQYNVFLDLAEHGIGNGIFEPFSFNVTVTNGVVTSVTPTATTDSFTPQNPPSTPPPPPAFGSPSFTVLGTFNAPVGGGGCAGLPNPNPPAGSTTIGVGDDCAVAFVMNVLNTAFIEFGSFSGVNSTPNSNGDILGALTDALGKAVVANQPYDPTATFTFTSGDLTGSDTGLASFAVTAFSSSTSATAAQNVNIEVEPDCDDSPATLCSTAASASSSSSTSSTPNTSETASAPPTATTAPTNAATTAPTTTPTSAPAGGAPTE